MSETGKIARNSLWLITAPLVLNVLSLAVTALIARSLGQIDYGHFVYASNLALIFVPLGDLGLRTLTIRSLAERPPQPELVLGRFLATRAFFTLLAFGALTVAAYLLVDSPEARLATLLMGATIIPRSLTTVAIDAFEAHEEMKYAAYSDMAAGLTLTLLSVVVILLGHGLVPLVGVYLTGRVLGLFLAAYYLAKHFLVPRPHLEGRFTRQALAQGAPFFYPSFIYGASQRLGIVLLTQFTGAASAGIYGAANDLVDRLTIIPEGLSGAFFPTLIRVYRDSVDEARALFRRFYGYSALIALPIAVGGTVVAPQIIDIIYGRTYGNSVFILQLLLWWLVLRFFNSLSSWTLGGIHRERLPAITVLSATPVFLAVSWISIPYGGPAALALSAVLHELICFVMLSFFLRNAISRQPFDSAVFLKIAVASAIMGGVVWALARIIPLGKWSLLVCVPAGVAVYGALVIGLRVASLDELRGLRRTLRKR